MLFRCSNVQLFKSYLPERVDLKQTNKNCLWCHEKEQSDDVPPEAKRKKKRVEHNIIV